MHRCVYRLLFLAFLIHYRVYTNCLLVTLNSRKYIRNFWDQEDIILNDVANNPYLSSSRVCYIVALVLMQAWWFNIISSLTGYLRLMGYLRMRSPFVSFSQPITMTRCVLFVRLWSWSKKIKQTSRDSEPKPGLWKQSDAWCIWVLNHHCWTLWQTCTGNKWLLSRSSPSVLHKNDQC